MTIAARRAGPIRFCVNAVLTMVIFVLAGPLVGTLAFFCVTGLYSGHGMGSGLTAFVVSLLLALPAPYIAGGPAAAFTGAFVAVSSRWILQPRWLYALAAAVGAASSVIGFYALSSLTRALVVTRGLGGIATQQNRDIAILAVIGAVAAISCTWLTKRLRGAGTMREV